MYILASASPRREQLLKKIIPEFVIIPSNIDETVPSDMDSLLAPEFLANQKAFNVFASHKDDIVISADTCIVFNNEIYGKPKDEAQAKEMLKAFSGKIHKVVTGVSIVSKKLSVSFSSISEVEFYDLTDKEIDDYLKTGEYKDKAGSYAIQGEGMLLIKRINGDYNSIIGLPISELNRYLKNFF